ncbi:MAG: hypothetical protein AAB583_04580 [Patescibacteria group bacterium]
MKKLISLLIIIIILEFLILNTDKFFGVKQANQSAPKNSSQLKKLTSEILAKCEGSPHKQSCYDEEIPKLMDPPTNISMKDAFEVTSLAQDKDKTYAFCHVLGHNLSAKEVKKDPSKWKEVVTRCPSGVCSNGCIHGGFQERFRSEFMTPQQLEDTKPDLLDLCEERGNWKPTGLEQGSCYHAVGHLLMYMTNADLVKSTNLCEEITKKSKGADYSQVCFDGVFMQVFQPLEPEDFALVKGKQPTKEEAYSFCEGFTSQKRGSCMSERWPLFRDEIMTSEGLVKFCSETLPQEIDRCFLSLFYVLPVQFNFNIEKLRTFCIELPQERRKQCFANIASRLIETDYRNIEKSIALCKESTPYDPDEKCFQELLAYSTYNFHKGSEEFYHLCNALPVDWKNKCLEKL